MEHSSFTVLLTGQLESVQLPWTSSAYCKYQLVCGEDWERVDGMQEGLTQAARRSKGGLVWNFPLDAAWRATSAYGWPQLLVAVYGSDALGRDVIKGYGQTHLPTCPGRYVLKLRLCRPKAASLLQAISGALAGMPPELIDPAFVATAEGRHVTQMQSSGCMVAQICIATKVGAGPPGSPLHQEDSGKADCCSAAAVQDMEAFGYASGAAASQGGPQQLL